MFRNSCVKPAGHWTGAFKNAALELHCLKEDISVSDLCRLTRVSRGTMNAYLFDGKQNKAYEELRKRLPKEMMNC